MMHQTLYRKWRPQNFDHVIGQQDTVTILKNSLKQGRVGHAYLFCGPRGTGKTSMARIMAKAVNCEKNGKPDPCNECPSCISITEGHNMDVIEIDAASNRGVDNIRELREKVRLNPVQSMYKIYIIDEVHMLTGEAFNALLKTLEEPPPHTIFIMATTEPQKLPPTIISRCQRFDFHRITSPEIAKKLQQMAETEGILIEASALNRIAESADGSMRDAESMLDQLSSYIQETVTENIILHMLGRCDVNTIHQFIKTLKHDEYTAIIQQLDDIRFSGIDASQLTKDMIAYLRDMFVLSITQSNQVVLKVLPFEKVDEYLQEASLFTPSWLVSLNKELVSILGDMRYLMDPWILLEITLLHFKFSDFVTVEADENVSRKKPVETKPVTETQTTAVKEKPKVVELTVEPENGIELPPQDDWKSFLNFIKPRDLMLLTLLLPAEFCRKEGSDLFIQYGQDHEYHLDQMAKPENKHKLEDLYNAYSGKSIHLKIIEKSSGSSEKKSDPKKKILEEPIIMDTLKLFNATVEEIEEIKGDS
ncbi:DNA polymerase III subunit gamma/tau [bacterium]|nr:DNA polymerase III subunit gamma/tau [bacterium]